jgi:hypothetical protein
VMALGKTPRGKGGATETGTLQRKGARQQDRPRR